MTPRNKRPARPAIQPPNPTSILDEITANTHNRPPGRPPFAQPAAEPEPAAAEPAPAAEVPAQPQPDDKPTPAPLRPASRRQARPAAPARRRQASASIPEPPPGYVASRKPLQVYVDGEVHWLLKYGALLRGTDMSKVVSTLVSAVVADMDTWTALIARAEEERVPLAELLAPHLERALDE